VAWAGCGRCREELAIAIDVDKRRRSVVQPAHRFERDVAGVSDQNEPAEL
jgi:hypothetical protein